MPDYSPKEKLRIAGWMITWTILGLGLSALAIGMALTLFSL